MRDASWWLVVAAVLLLGLVWAVVPVAAETPAPTPDYSAIVEPLETLAPLMATVAARAAVPEPTPDLSGVVDAIAESATAQALASEVVHADVTGVAVLVVVLVMLGVAWLVAHG